MRARVIRFRELPSVFDLHDLVDQESEQARARQREREREREREEHKFIG